MPAAAQPPAIPLADPERGRSWGVRLTRFRAPLRRRTWALILLGVVAYAGALVAMIPARAMIAKRDDLRLGGTIWAGQAVVGSTLRVDWRWSPLASLAALGFAADWHAAGGSTDLAGTVVRRHGAWAFSDVSGVADGTLVDALAPGLPFACRFTADVRLRELVVDAADSHARGTIRTSPANCSARGLAGVAAGSVIDVPALRGEVVPGANVSSLTLATIAARQPVIEARLARDGTIAVWPTSIATRLAPFLVGMRYDSKL